MHAAKKMIEDPFYHRLFRDLQRGKRRRKISYEKYRWVSKVLTLPPAVPEHQRGEITQAMLDAAHRMADLIKRELNGPRLHYDSTDRMVMLHGSYGSRQ